MLKFNYVNLYIQILISIEYVVLLLDAWSTPSFNLEGHAFDSLTTYQKCAVASMHVPHDLSCTIQLLLTPTFVGMACVQDCLVPRNYSVAWDFRSLAGLEFHMNSYTPICVFAADLMMDPYLSTYCQVVLINSLYKINLYQYSSTFPAGPSEAVD